MFFSLTGLKVPIPTCKVTFAICIPFFSISFKSSFVKWSPAVGAAADPSYFAYTVWYLSLSFKLSCIYGGNGISPIWSNISLNIPSYVNLTFLVPSCNVSKISACNIPFPNITFAPLCNLLPGLTIASQISPSKFFNNTNSTLAPVSFFPYSLAGITFVLFLTRQSPGLK